MTIQLDSNQTNSPKYLSLREAAQLYGYTRDHLGLMIRRGRLKGVRLGNYYATCAEWMNEYIKNYSDFDNLKSKSKFSNKFRSDILDKKPTSTLLSLASGIGSGAKPREKSKAKTSDLAELQEHIDQVLSQALPKMSTLASLEMSSEPKIETVASSLSKNSVEDHGLTILPVRKMHDFERQIIISQAKRQKNNS